MRQVACTCTGSPSGECVPSVPCDALRAGTVTSPSTMRMIADTSPFASGPGATSTPPMVISPVEITARFSTKPFWVENPSYCWCHARAWSMSAPLTPPTVVYQLRTPAWSASAGPTRSHWPKLSEGIRW